MLILIILLQAAAFGQNRTDMPVLIVEKAKAEEAGYDLLSEKYVQFIDGRVKLEKNHLMFIPDKPEKFKSHTFTVIYQAETDQVKHLIDENNHILSTSDCPLSIVSM